MAKRTSNIQRPTTATRTDCCLSAFLPRTTFGQSWPLPQSVRCSCHPLIPGVQQKPHQLIGLHTLPPWPNQASCFLKQVPQQFLPIRGVSRGTLLHEGRLTSLPESALGSSAILRRSWDQRSCWLLCHSHLHCQFMRLRPATPCHSPYCHQQHRWLVVNWLYQRYSQLRLHRRNDLNCP